MLNGTWLSGLLSINTYNTLTTSGGVCGAKVRLNGGRLLAAFRNYSFQLSKEGREDRNV